MNGEKQTGQVKFFKINGGYGFIAPDQGGEDVFFHRSACERAGIPVPLHEGTRLAFTIEASRKPGKLQAANLEVVG